MPGEQIGARVATLYELQSAWLEPRLLEIDVRWTTFQLLATVIGAGDAASQAEVARRLGLAPATMSETVANHVAAGMIEQVPSPNDRRVKVLRLTSKGQTLMIRVRELVEECESVMSKKIKSGDAATAAKVIDKMIATLESELGD